MHYETDIAARPLLPLLKKSGSILCSKDALTDDFGWTVQAVLACLAFMCLILKRFCEPVSHRRSWLTWFYDTSKQGLGSLVIHFANIYLAVMFQGDPCTWYIVTFLLDSSVGLLVIYTCIRLIVRLAEKHKWKHLYFGEYGNPPSIRAWAIQSGMYMAIMVVEKVLITCLVQLEFWDTVRDLILSPIRDPKVAITVVLLVIPFFVNVLMFWVTDNFLMKKPKRNGRKFGVRYQQIGNNNGTASSTIDEDSDCPISGDEELLDTASLAITLSSFKSVDELLNVNRRNNSVV